MPITHSHPAPNTSFITGTAAHHTALFEAHPFAMESSACTSHCEGSNYALESVVHDAVLESASQPSKGTIFMYPNECTNCHLREASLIIIQLESKPVRTL